MSCLKAISLTLSELNRNGVLEWNAKKLTVSCIADFTVHWQVRIQHTKQLCTIFQTICYLPLQMSLSSLFVSSVLWGILFKLVFVPTLSCATLSCIASTVGSKSIQPPWRLPLTAIVNKTCNIVCCVYNSNISNHPKYDFFKV